MNMDPEFLVIDDVLDIHERQLAQFAAAAVYATAAFSNPRLPRHRLLSAENGFIRTSSKWPLLMHFISRKTNRSLTGTKARPALRRSFSRH